MKYIISIIFMLVFCIVEAPAQNVIKEGNTFTQVSTSSASKGKETKTDYTYKTKDGKTYDIYLSAKGKAFIKRISSKTGKEYKQYLPEVGKQINPSAYQEKPKKES